MQLPENILKQAIDVSKNKQPVQNIDGHNYYNYQQTMGSFQKYTIGLENLV